MIEMTARMVAAFDLSFTRVQLGNIVGMKINSSDAQFNNQSLKENDFIEF
ncbi:hypothetical protein [Shimazuella alba]|uniref:Uncharacterized protein n=1 Tax=Shimazuella alba TaxID=2690964 RepID=A0A6I4W4C1_9BACL|nr:hypothetical protein [Shimazuella alba]MXQ55624.1 hypothetical protein [Shimazuella alba]